MSMWLCGSVEDHTAGDVVLARPVQIGAATEQLASQEDGAQSCVASHSALSR